MDKEDERLLNIILDVQLGRYGHQMKEPEEVLRRLLEDVPSDETRGEYKKRLLEGIPHARRIAVEGIVSREAESSPEKVAGVQCDRWEHITDECIIPSCSRDGETREMVVGDPDLLQVTLCQKHYDELREIERVWSKDEFIEGREE